jgi:DNA invertase Pin-like site-specific DNA recombinase
MSRRTPKRSLGKRERRRKARDLAARVVDLSEEGYSPSVIASQVGLPVAFVAEALKRASEAEATDSEAEARSSSKGGGPANGPMPRD